MGARLAGTGSLCLYGVLVALGALLHPHVAAVGGLVLGCAAGALVAVLRRHADHGTRCPPRPELAFVAAAGLPAALAGASALGPWGGPASVLLMVTAALTGASRSGSPHLRPSAPATGNRRAPGNEAFMRQVLTAMPTSLLLDEWQVTHHRLAAVTPPPLWVVRLRDLLIDELRCRDPGGTARWLSAGLAEPPERYIRPEPDGGAGPRW